MFGPPSSFTSLSNALGPLSTKLYNNVKNLSVFLDTSLNFNKQFSCVVKNSFYQIKILATLKLFYSHQEITT